MTLIFESFMTGVTRGTVNISVAFEFIQDFSVGSCCSIFSLLCSVWYILVVSSWPFCLGQGIVCPLDLSVLAKVLCVLLTFLSWPRYCVSFSLFYLGQGIVCLLVLSILAKVLCVLLTFLSWPRCYVSFDSWLLLLVTFLSPDLTQLSPTWHLV